MEQITIRSGLYEVLVSGSVISFKNNPIELILGPKTNQFKVILNFEIVDDKSKIKVEGKALDSKTIEITFAAKAGSFNGNWTIEPISLGIYNSRSLYINIHFYIFEEKQISLHYTFYIGDRMPSSPLPGGENQ